MQRADNTELLPLDSLLLLCCFKAFLTCSEDAPTVVFLSLLRALAMEPGSIDNLSILYQSSDFIVVNKHWDIRIDSKMWYEKLTLQSQLKYRFPELADPDTYYGFR